MRRLCGVLGTWGYSVREGWGAIVSGGGGGNGIRGWGLREWEADNGEWL